MYEYIVYAHRGASSYAPENTMSAFNKALELGANGIELDLKKTKNDKVVIFHDNKIDKKSNSVGKLSEYTYEELLKFDFGSWFDNKKFRGEKIVLFEDFMKVFGKENITLAIELKDYNIEKEVLDIIIRYGNIDKIFITSFEYNILRNVRALNKDIKIGWLINDDITTKNIDRIKEINIDQICPNANVVSKQGIRLARENLLSVRLWGINDVDVMKKAYELDTDGMTVNFPDKLIDLINEVK